MNIMLTATIFMYVYNQYELSHFQHVYTILAFLNVHCSVIMLCPYSCMYPLLCLHCIYMIFSEGLTLYKSRLLLSLFVLLFEL